MTNQNVQTNRYGPQNKGCNQASAKRFVLNFALCYFVFVFFSPFSIAITLLGEERANLSAFRRFVGFALV